MAPYIAFQRRDIEVADQNGGLVELRGPSDHSLQEIDLLPEFGILSPVRNLATRRTINVFKTNAIVQPHAHVARFPIRLPIEAIILADRKLADDGDHVMHGLTMQYLVVIAKLTEGTFGKGLIRSEEHKSELPSLMRITYDVFCLK